VWDSLRLFAAVENITDKDYRVHGSGVNEPGTNAVLGLHLTF
jgi:hemoglobin/transferrin/lactoferrin receptor protein